MADVVVVKAEDEFGKGQIDCEVDTNTARSAVGVLAPWPSGGVEGV